MRKIQYFDTELTVEEYIRKEILKNAGSQNIALKSDLEKMCNIRNIEYDKQTTKEELLNSLIKYGVSYEEIASCFSVGVSSQVYQKAFGISHTDIKRLEKHGALEVVGTYRYRAFGQYNYAPLYDLYQYAKMSDADIQSLLEQYPKGKRGQRKETQTTVHVDQRRKEDNDE